MAQGQVNVDPPGLSFGNINLIVWHFVREVDKLLQQIVREYPPRPAKQLNGDAVMLTIRLITPEKTEPIEGPQPLVIRATQDGVEAGPLANPQRWQALPGAHLVFTIRGDGLAYIQPDGEIVPFPPGPLRLVIAVGDRYSTVSITVSDGGRTAVNGKRIYEGNQAMIQNVAELSVWECTCGTEQCKGRHRLSSWVQRPDVSLEAFVASAVKGPTVNIVHDATAFTQGMYFALLTEGQYA